MGKRKGDHDQGNAESSEKKRKGPISGQGTIAQAFRAGKDPSTVTTPLEQRTKAPSYISNYGTFNILNAYNQYQAEVSEKMRDVPPMEETLTQGKRGDIGDISDDSDSYEPPECKTLEPENEAYRFGEDGYRYIQQLTELTSTTTMPARSNLQHVVGIVRNHGLHGRRDLSPFAFKYLQYVVKLHPSIKVECTEGPDKVPYVLVNEDAWTLADCAGDLKLDPFDVYPSAQKPTAFQVLEHLLNHVHSALFSEHQGKVPARGFAVASGEFLLLKWIISEFRKDLKARLTVFNSIPGHRDFQRKAALLQNSQLWRTFSNAAQSTQSWDRKNMVRVLMEIAAAPAESELLNKAHAVEDLVFNASGLSDLAAQLLRMLLELYGTAEEFRMFYKKSLNRTTTSGTLEHVRMTIEDAMLEGFTGMNQVLKTLSQKQAFLAALPHKDRMRLLTMVVAIKHAKRTGDQERYPSLENFYLLYNEHGSVDSYLRAEPYEALRYILDDLKASSLSFNLVDRTADGLALLVANLCQSAAHELPDDKLLEMSPVLDKIVQAMRESQGGRTKQSLSPQYILALRAAQHSLQPTGS